MLVTPTPSLEAAYLENIYITLSYVSQKMVIVYLPFLPLSKITRNGHEKLL